MKKYLSLLLFILITPFAVFADNHEEVIADVWVMTPKAGHEMKFEEAMKVHVAHRKANGDNRQWNVWRPVTGDDMNAYYVRSCCDTWAAQDEYVKVASKLSDHFNETVGPHVESFRHNFSAMDSENSNWGDGKGVTMVGVTTFYSKPGMGAVRSATVKQMSDLAKEKGWPRNWSWAYPIGGKSRMMLVTPFKNYADMAPLEESFGKFATKHIGEEATEKMFADWGSTMKGSSYKIYRHVKDLSTPADK